VIERTVFLGEASLPAALPSVAEPLEEQGKTLLFVATGNRVAGIYAAADTLCHGGGWNRHCGGSGAHRAYA